MKQKLIDLDKLNKIKQDLKEQNKKHKPIFENYLSKLWAFKDMIVRVAKETPPCRDTTIDLSERYCKLK